MTLASLLGWTARFIQSYKRPDRSAALAAFGSWRGTYPALTAILAALFSREKTGQGMVIDTSILDGTLLWGIVRSAPQMTDVNGVDEDQTFGARYTAYQCADGCYPLRH